MFKFFSKKGGRNRGFTLIELLVVIAIIGVLASIVLASLNNARKKSRDARRLTDVKQIQLALELYFDGKGSTYPTATATCDESTNAYGLEALSANGYIPQVPRDPLSSTASPICYKYSTATGASPYTTYHLGGTIEDSANPALNNDKDCNDQAGAGAPVCATGAGATNGFSGADPVYDVTP